MKLSDLPCSAPLYAGCSCLWGVICSGFGPVSFPCTTAGFFPLLGPVLACKFWYVTAF
ncbi:hypothetical protein SLEP1_g50969 [Rubroshorea leprosula]|uniref:Uncharacterized protein n=1 Tax=Rubroshorea leprosula TaxID=152421 RepID=A0AAV5M1T1_9ROSI|nr:hypothetical protein SLEP1_g50969 [Rubroshorea leprosula]